MKNEYDEYEREKEDIFNRANERTNQIIKSIKMIIIDN